MLEVEDSLERVRGGEEGVLGVCEGRAPAPRKLRQAEAISLCYGLVCCFFRSLSRLYEKLDEACSRKSRLDTQREKLQ